MASILIVDDDQAQLTILQRILKREGYTVEIVEDSKAALDSLEQQMFDLVISDMWMSSRFEGRDLLREIKRTDPDLPVLIMTAFAELNDAVNLVAHEGAFYYLEKPIQIEVLKREVKHALQTRGALRRIEEESDDTTPEIQVDEIVGDSEKMQGLFKNMARILHRGVTQVLITGETGSGKSLIARALHKHGPRKKKPFISINCGAIPETLIESELFGHEKGAFTDAAQQKKGLFEVANEGVLFLDEIGDLPVQTQSKLLHVLEEREIRRIGGTRNIKVDVCVIAATNKNLVQAVRDSAFREDLYFRLNVIPLHVPPLREHPEDIPLLVNFLIQKFSSEYAEAPPKQVTPQAISVLRRYHWPGNIRQLENICRYLTVMSSSNIITLDDLPDDFADEENDKENSDISSWEDLLRNNIRTGISKDINFIKDTSRKLESILIDESLKATKGVKQEAAKLLGWGRNTLAKKAKES